MDSGTSTANFLTCMSGNSGLKGFVSLLKGRKEIPLGEERGME